MDPRAKRVGKVLSHALFPRAEFRIETSLDRHAVFDVIMKCVTQENLPFFPKEDGLFGKVTDTGFQATPVFIGGGRFGTSINENPLTVEAEVMELRGSFVVHVLIWKSRGLTCVFLGLFCFFTVVAMMSFLDDSSEYPFFFTVVAVLSAAWLLMGRDAIHKAAKMVESRLSPLRSD